MKGFNKYYLGYSLQGRLLWDLLALDFKKLNILNEYFMNCITKENHLGKNKISLIKSWDKMPEDEKEMYGKHVEYLIFYLFEERTEFDVMIILN